MIILDWIKLIIYIFKQYALHISFGQFNYYYFVFFFSFLKKTHHYNFHDEIKSIEY